VTIRNRTEATGPYARCVGAEAAYGRAVCRRCGCDSLREYGEVEIVCSVTRQINVVFERDGSISAKSARHLDQGEFDVPIKDFEDLAHFFRVECIACGLEAKHIDELAIREPGRGTRVNLPDGRTAYIDDTRTAVRGGTQQLEVLAAGEWWAYADVEAWAPHPGQLALEAA
jgi:hypothetical protein